MTDTRATEEGRAGMQPATIGSAIRPMEFEW